MCILWFVLVCGWLSTSAALGVFTGRSRHKLVEVTVEFGTRIDLFAPTVLTHTQQRFFLGYGGALHRYTGEVQCNTTEDASSAVCDALNALVGDGSSGWELVEVHGWEISFTAQNRDQLQLQMMKIGRAHV